MIHILIFFCALQSGLLITAVLEMAYLRKSRDQWRDLSDRFMVQCFRNDPKTRAYLKDEFRITIHDDGRVEKE